MDWPTIITFAIGVFLGVIFEKICRYNNEMNIVERYIRFLIKIADQIYDDDVCRKK